MGERWDADLDLVEGGRVVEGALSKSAFLCPDSVVAAEKVSYPFSLMMGRRFCRCCCWLDRVFFRKAMLSAALMAFGMGFGGEILIVAASSLQLGTVIAASAHVCGWMWVKCVCVCERV